MYFVILAVIAVALFIMVKFGIAIVPQSRAYVVERLGAYHKTWNVGIHFLIPFLDTVAMTRRRIKGNLILERGVSLKEDLFTYEKEGAITKDNVKLEIGTVVFYQIVDPKLYTYGVSDPEIAVQALTSTTLRNLIGELELDETLTSRDTINVKLRTILDDASDAWGIKVIRVEISEITPPVTVTDAMEKQMTAERQKRADILKAEGAKQSAILNAEGIKQATILQAEATKEAAIKEAEGQAQAILTVQTAIANGLAKVKDIVGEEGAIKLKSFEAFEKVADGQSTKIIIPSELQNLASTVTSIVEVAKK